jgi:hypothetical protein
MAVSSVVRLWSSTVDASAASARAVCLRQFSWGNWTSLCRSLCSFRDYSICGTAQRPASLGAAVVRVLASIGVGF